MATKKATAAKFDTKLLIGGKFVAGQGPAEDVLNPASGKCLDDPNSSTTEGTQVQIWTCNGTGAQRWNLS